MDRTTRIRSCVALLPRAFPSPLRLTNDTNAPTARRCKAGRVRYEGVRRPGRRAVDRQPMRPHPIEFADGDRSRGRLQPPLGREPSVVPLPCDDLISKQWTGCPCSGSGPPVRLELPILSWNQDSGNVAWRLRSDLRCLAHEGPPVRPTSRGRHSREALQTRRRASRHR